MAVFVLVEGDPFEGALEQSAERAVVAPGATSEYSHVRRPVRGIQLKAPTYATLQVFTETLTPVGLYDGGGVNDDEGGNWASQPAISNFLIQDVQRTQEEKFQVVETFGADYGFFFGQKPIIYQFSGALMNTADFNWASEWWANYDEILRGTKLVEKRARVYMTFDTVVLEGYLIQSSSQWSASEPYHTPFGFAMWVTRWSDTSAVGSTDFPLSSGTSVEEIEGASITLEQSLRSKIRDNLDEYMSEPLLGGGKFGTTSDPVAVDKEAQDDIEATTATSEFLDDIGVDMESYPPEFVNAITAGDSAISVSGSSSFFQTRDEIDAGQTPIALPDTTVIEAPEAGTEGAVDLLDLLES